MPSKQTSRKKQTELHEYPPILTVGDLAEVIRCSIRTIYNKRSIGADLPPSIDLEASKLLFSRDVVEQWLNGEITGDSRRV